MARLNGWQRLWVVLTFLLFVPAAFLILALWPYRDYDVVRDLAAAECDSWRNLPAGFFPDEHPAQGERCSAIQAFLWDKHADVRSVAQYGSWLGRQKWKAIGIGVFSLAIASALIYLVGWSVAWVRRGFRERAT